MPASLSAYATAARRLSALLLALACCLSAAARDLRTWTRASDASQKVDAELRGFDGTNIVIYRPDKAKEYTLPLSTFSAADHRYVLTQYPQYAPGATTTPGAPATTPVTTTPATPGAPATPAALLDGLSWSPSLAIILAVVNLPIIIFLWGRIFFTDLQGFFDALGYVLKPDWISFWHGDGMEDWWQSFKFNAFFVWCLLTLAAQYVLIQKTF